MTEPTREPVEPDADKKQRAGHPEIVGETLAKWEFFAQDWNPYSRYLDVDKVDLILRRRRAPSRPIYREVQVKFGKLHSVPKWAKGLFTVSSFLIFKANEFDKLRDRADFFVVFVLAERMKYEGDIFIFPVAKFVPLLKSAIRSGDKRKVYIVRQKDDPTRWFLLKQGSKFTSLDESTAIEVSHFRRNFDALQ
jgi:hypothetical protein